jgi:hypothetical protein
MTEFAEDLRHRCRNPHCRTKLNQPVENLHKAFCKRGYYDSFYLKRCLVCEKDKPAGSTARRKLCRRPKCKTRYGKDTAHYSFRALGSALARNAPKSAQSTGIKSADFDDRPWRIVAGPPLTPNQLHCATDPDGPDCQWKGGDYERLEAKNRAALKKHFAELAKQCLIQPHHPPVNVLGGYRFPGVPTIDLSPLPIDDAPKRSDWRPCSPSVPVADDLGIPDFLKREQKQRSGDITAEAAE